MNTCKNGHPRTLGSTYFKAGRYWCKPCRIASQKARRSAASDLLIEREIEWLIDLPNIVEESDSQARLTTNEVTKSARD